MGGSVNTDKALFYLPPPGPQRWHTMLAYADGTNHALERRSSALTRPIGANDAWVSRGCTSAPSWLSVWR